MHTSTQPTTTTIEIESLLEWGPVAKVKTRNGPMQVRKAPPSRKFSALWKANKEALKAVGIGWGKNRRDDWEVCWWTRDQEGAVTTERRYRESFEHTTTETLPCAAPYTPYGYQIIGARFTLDRQRVLLADDMGLGKTMQTILVCNADETIRDAVIVCPSTVKINWQREFDKFGTRKDTEIHTLKGMARKNARQAALMAQAPPRGLRVWIINYDILTAWVEFLHSKEWCLVCLDESHTIKNNQSKRTQAIVGRYNRSTKVWDGQTRARYRMCLSGTPLENNPGELKTSLQWLGAMRNFPKFNERYLAGGNRDELNRLLRENIMIRRLKTQVLTDLPGKVRTVIPFEGPEDIMGQLRSIEREIEMKVGSKLEDMRAGASRQEDLDAVLAKLESGGFPGVPFELIARVRRLTGEAKVEAAVQHITSLHEGIAGKPILAFFNHIEKVLDPVLARLREGGLRVARLSGREAPEKKQILIDQFQGGEIDVMLCQTRAAGVGINLTRAENVVFCEFDWTPSKMVQAEDRANRIGQTAVVVVHILALENSLDCRMAELVATKADMTRTILDDDRRTSEPLQAPQETAKAHCTHVQVEQPAATDKEAQKREERYERWNRIPTGLTMEKRVDLQARLSTIARMCDGAMQDDGCGFNRMDSQRGKQLAFRGIDAWSDSDERYAQHFVRKYQRQCGLPDWMAT